MLRYKYYFSTSILSNKYYFITNFLSNKYYFSTNVLSNKFKSDINHLSNNIILSQTSKRTLFDTLKNWDISFKKWLKMFNFYLCFKISLRIC